MIPSLSSPTLPIVNIQPVRPDDTYRERRAQACRNRFPSIKVEQLSVYESHSEAFEILKNGLLVGGFQLTPLGFGRSELEEVFAGYPFPKKQLN